MIWPYSGLQVRILSGLCVSVRGPAAGHPRPRLLSGLPGSPKCARPAARLARPTARSRGGPKGLGQGRAKQGPRGVAAPATIAVTGQLQLDGHLWPRHMLQYGPKQPPSRQNQWLPATHASTFDATLLSSRGRQDSAQRPPASAIPLLRLYTNFSLSTTDLKRRCPRGARELPRRRRALAAPPIPSPPAPGRCAPRSAC